MQFSGRKSLAFAASIRQDSPVRKTKSSGNEGTAGRHSTAMDPNNIPGDTYCRTQIASMIPTRV
ncbi:MAG: hypothetical protein WBO17_14155 [Sphingorhabdus sp.]